MKNRLSTLFSFVILVVFVSCNSAPLMTDMEEWDMVWISDSSGWGVAEVYAAMVEEDTGIKVNVNDFWMDSLSAGEVYNTLKGEKTSRFKLTQLIDLIPEAELIVFFANPINSVESNARSDWNCTGGNNYVNICQDFELYKNHLEGIYQIIFELRGGQATIVRAYDAYNPLIADFHKQGVYEDCKACWADLNAAIHQAADNYNIPVAEVSKAWNGSNWDMDPVVSGYTKDGIHPNELGAKVIAQAIRELGYKPVKP